MYGRCVHVMSASWQHTASRPATMPLARAAREVAQIPAWPAATVGVARRGCVRGVDKRVAAARDGETAIDHGACSA